MTFFDSLNKDVLLAVYTDGACAGNPGPGGWGVVIKANNLNHEFYGGEAHTTNNRMELQACIEALSHIPSGRNITIYTDSKYVKDGITSWLKRWLNNGWTTADKKPVKNKDLWQQLDLLVKNHKVNWQWVPGHAGNRGNERADMLARQGIASARIKG